MAITGTTILVLNLLIKSLHLNWRSGTYRFHIQAHDLQNELECLDSIPHMTGYQYKYRSANNGQILSLTNQKTKKSTYKWHKCDEIVLLVAYGIWWEFLSEWRQAANPYCSGMILLLSFAFLPAIVTASETEAICTWAVGNVQSTPSFIHLHQGYLHCYSPAIGCAIRPMEMCLPTWLAATTCVRAHMLHCRLDTTRPTFQHRLDRCWL